MRAFALGLVIVLAGVMAASPMFDDVRVASACSCPDCDVVRDAEVIVAGRIIGWQPSEIPSPFGGSSVYLPIELDLEVDRVFKGAAPGSVTMVDFASYGNLKDPVDSQAPDRITWSGAGGACGAFDEDPRGKYIVIGFGDTPLHPWQSNRMRILFMGDEPSGEWYERAMARLGVLGGPYPPAAGNSPAASTESDDPNDWMFVSAIGVGVLLFTLVALMVGPRRDRKP